MKELKVGSRVTDGHGARGIVARVVKPELSPHDTISAKEVYYIWWNIREKDVKDA